MILYLQLAFGVTPVAVRRKDVRIQLYVSGSAPIDCAIEAIILLILSL